MNTRRCTYIFVAVLALACLFIRSAGALDPARQLTQYVHRIWQVQQGLPEATIFRVLQTRDGFLWLGTLTGLAKFDGVRFTSVTTLGAHSLERTTVTDLVEDASGTLWIATDSRGVFAKAGEKITHYDTKAKLPSDRVYDLVLASDAVYACTQAGVGRIAGEKVEPIKLSDAAKTEVRAGTVLADGSLLFAAKAGGMILYKDGKPAPRPLADVPADALVQAILATPEGTWVGTSAGLVRLGADGTQKVFTTADGLAADDVTCLLQTRDKQFLAGTRAGFSRMIPDGGGGKFTSFRARDGLSQSTVYSLCEDAEGGLWVGTKHGLDQFMDGRTIPITVSEGLPTNNVGPVLQAANGVTWLGTQDAGLILAHGSGFYRHPVIEGPIYALCDDGKGTLWIGTEKGAQYLEGVKGVENLGSSNISPPELPDPRVVALACDSSGVLWAGTAKGIAALRNGKFVPVGDGSPVRAVIRAKAGGVLAATDDGLYHVTDGPEGVDVKLLTGSRNINSVFQDSEGTIWLATHGNGLIRVEGASTGAYTVRDGLFDDDLYAITTDESGRLWITCSKGIFAVYRSDLIGYKPNKGNRIPVTTISPTDALRTIESRPGVSPGIFRMSDGRIWFSTIRGYISITPERIPRRLPPPPVVIESVTVNGHDQSLLKPGNVPPGLKHFEVRYTALSYFAPARMTFKYKLEGFDRDWVNVGTRREADYTNLPPGKYLFRVAAANADGTWNEEGASFAFTVQPFFYQRAWFPWACVAAVLAAGYLIYAARVNTIRRRAELVTAERSRIARELHDTLIQGFSGVTMEMKALSVRLGEKPEAATLHEIIRDAGECLREARHSVAGLRDSTPSAGFSDTLTRAVRELVDGRPVKLRLNLQESPRQLPGDVQHNLIRIAREAVGNAVRHASPKNVDVTLEVNEKLLHLIIRDDGAGFDLDADTPQSHFGLVGMRERAADIGAAVTLDSSPGKGTTVAVTLPLRKEPGV